MNPQTNSTEEAQRADLAGLLVATVEASGRPRGEMARCANGHQDAPERILGNFFAGEQGVAHV